MKKLNSADIYYFGIAILVIGLPLSKFLMSVSQFILIGSWLIDGNIPDKIRKFLNNKTALVISSVFIIHLLGLLYSVDFEYGFEDIRKKIPLFLLPLIISTSPVLSQNRFRTILSLYVFSVVIGTFVSSYILFGFSGKEIINIRSASIFISHIRFSLMICLAVFISFYLYVKLDRFKYFFLAISVWCIIFLFIMQTLSATIAFIGVLLFLVLRKIVVTQNKQKRVVLGGLFLLIPVTLAFYLWMEVYSYQNRFVKISNTTKEFSLSGEKYFHNPINGETENGYLIWHNVAFNELRETWSNKSKIPFDGKDLRGNDIGITLIRYLSSKGLDKDAIAVNSLNENDISAIEQGVPNEKYQNQWSFRTRIQVVIWEIDQYLNGRNPNGHSLTMRFEFWKAASGIIRDNLIFGVGTGDVKNEFKEQYKRMDSQLENVWRLRSHNQYIEVAVALGVIGLALFVFSIYYPLSFKVNRRNYLYLVFITIAIISMLNEDTLENQAGVTFFAFFNSFFLFSRVDNSSFLEKESELVTLKDSL